MNLIEDFEAAVQFEEQQLEVQQKEKALLAEKQQLDLQRRRLSQTPFGEALLLVGGSGDYLSVAKTPPPPPVVVIPLDEAPPSTDSSSSRKNDQQEEQDVSEARSPPKRKRPLEERYLLENYSQWPKKLREGFRSYDPPIKPGGRAKYTPEELQIREQARQKALASYKAEKEAKN